MQYIFSLCVVCLLMPLYGSSHQAVKGFPGTGIFSSSEEFRLNAPRTDSCKRGPKASQPIPVITKSKASAKTNNASAHTVKPHCDGVVQTAEGCGGNTVPTILNLLNNKFSI